jgi:hypothetical protein
LLSAAALTLRASCGRLLVPLESKFEGNSNSQRIGKTEGAASKSFPKISILSDLFRISDFEFEFHESDFEFRGFPLDFAHRPAI